MIRILHASSAALALVAATGCDERNVAEPASAAVLTDASAKVETVAKAPPQAAARAAGFDPRNSRFTMDGETVVLKDGLSQAASAPGLAGTTTRYFGETAHGDLNSDGQADTAFLVTRDGGGSGRFYYVVAAIDGKGGHKSTNAFFVGDRIEPQSLRIFASELHVSFLGREQVEPMSAPPTRPSVLLLKVTPQGVLEGLAK